MTAAILRIAVTIPTIEKNLIDFAKELKASSEVEKTNKKDDEDVMQALRPPSL